MTKIGIDARLLNQTGVGVYIYNLLFYLQDIFPADWYANVYLRKEDISKINLTNSKFIKREANFGWHTISEQTRFFRLISKDGLDLMHFTYFSYPVLYKEKFILTIHDLTPVLFKTGKASTKNFLTYNIKYFAMKYVMSKALKNSSYIITPSVSVQKELVDNFGALYQSKIISIYEGINNKIKSAKENKNLKKNMPEKFIAYIGNFYPHKNVERLIKAFEIADTDARLVLAGPDDYFFRQLVRTFEQSNQSGKVIFFTNPRLEDLVFLYKNASALIHPSLSEGFGLTNIEAAYFNCPIIASNIPVFKEILDDEYLSFDPRSERDIAEKIESFFSNKPNPEYKSILKRFSFRKMAEETFKVYQRCVDQKKVNV